MRGLSLFIFNLTSGEPQYVAWRDGKCPKCGGNGRWAPEAPGFPGGLICHACRCVFDDVGTVRRRVLDNKIVARVLQ